MNEDGVSEWKSYRDEIAININFILFYNYSMKYIDMYGIFPELVQKLV